MIKNWTKIFMIISVFFVKRSKKLKNNPRLQLAPKATKGFTSVFCIFYLMDNSLCCLHLSQGNVVIVISFGTYVIIALFSYEC